MKHVSMVQRFDPPAYRAKISAAAADRARIKREVRAEIAAEQRSAYEALRQAAGSTVNTYGAQQAARTGLFGLF